MSADESSLWEKEYVVEKHPLRWWALAVAVLAVLVDMIDNQIVAVALPTIQRELGTGIPRCSGFRPGTRWGSRSP